MVLGIGNTIRADEGVGVRVVEALERDYALPADVVAIDGGTSSMEMLEELSHLDFLLVVDAIDDGRPPGELVRLEGEAVPVFFRRNLSPHGIGLSDVLAALEFMGAAPKETVILGVQPGSLELATALTPPIAAQVPALVAQVVDELSRRGLAPMRKVGADETAHVL
ncbi:HyaD/HybD family hydrogenase maturation endopeptidase [Sulfuricystis multivorans]|uniref:HyaD/HybD family hydrogenase maturation endopeptidase n=1 Tax=Sulfuricystis multivorans TaxID=2211108 RepID=UPI0024DF3D25|nr:HyaD/HybD family hydrogenase maturation endopeptidase [Sulfuricystis multivorans]